MREGASSASCFLWGFGFGLSFFFFHKYKRIKTFLVRKQTPRKRSQKSDRAVNLIAIAIILQMTNNKESIIQRMISEVKSTKLLRGENQLSPMQLCGCTAYNMQMHRSYHSHRNLNIKLKRKKSKEFYKNHWKKYPPHEWMHICFIDTATMLF